MAVGKVLAQRLRSGGKLSRPASIVLTLLFLFGPSTIRADDWITGTGGRAGSQRLSTADTGPPLPAVLWDTCPNVAYGGFQAGDRRRHRRVEPVSTLRR